MSTQVDSNNYAIQEESNHKKGDALIRYIETEYLMKGYFVIARYGRSKGIDIIVVLKRSGKIFAIAECKNYQQYSRNGHLSTVHDNTFWKDIDNLDKFDVFEGIEKWFITSYETTITRSQKEILESHKIKHRWLGFEPEKEDDNEES
jgi:hypothetical protein